MKLICIYANKCDVKGYVQGPGALRLELHFGADHLFT